MRHHPLLHTGKRESSSAASSIRSVSHQHHHSSTSFALLRYLPVTLHGNGKSVELYAFLDDGSSSTMLEAEVANLLGVKGPNEPLSLGWTGDVTRIENDSQRIEITISGTNEDRRFPLKAKTVGPLKLPSQTIDYEELCETYPHFKKLPLTSYFDASPRLIIGVDNARLIRSLKSREGSTGELIASKTRLGWCVYGTHTAGMRFVEYVNVHVELAENEPVMHDLFRQFLAIEKATISQAPQSEEDKRALKILEETTRRVDGRFEAGLLWRYEEPCLPNSFPMAVRRMVALERKLAKDSFLDGKVREQIAEYVEKGYAHRITAEELESTEPGRVWYLPLGVVRNPRKPGKVRLIWDAAARVEGVSLNDRMLKGPDLLAALPTILTRFRQKQIAFCGDIREMFHQFLIRPRDRQAQRFIFREHPDEDPQTFVMDVATFGAACSPCIAQYLKNKNAKEYAEQFPEAAKAVIENHYVDDYLDSVDTVEEAVKLIEEVKYLHSMAGMEIRNFSSNSAEVFEQIGQPNNVQHKVLSPESSTQRVLGIIWRSTEDVLSFDINLKEEIRGIVERQEAPTKRQVLCTIMSLFDPLGLVAHFTIQGKIIMQRIWRTGATWDEAISGEILEDWRKWSSMLEKLSEVRVPRCFFAIGSTTPKDAQIHVFVDASENAYACVAYIRSSCSGIPRCTIMAAKTKVAPLKPISIPRLELQAALIGTRLLDSICKSLTIPIAARYLWTDSTTVLAWLRSETRRYHQFVGLRIGEILGTTTVDEWRKVPSKINVADQATKWRDGPKFDPEDWWYAGPSFLKESEEVWRMQKDEQFATTEDLRNAFLHHRVVQVPLIDVSRFSKWSRLHRTAGYVVRAVELFLGLNTKGPLTQEELQKAECLIWRQAQMQGYPDEYSVLTYNKEYPDKEPGQINKTSPLYKMTPVLDEDGVMRMDSRISAAPREQLQTINENCSLSFTNSCTKWLFNPPLAPHMGGSWERMVRSVKTAMEAIADHPRHPSDEVLETIAIEAESIVNSRPLTYIPLDNAEQEALTPNHFLLYGTQGINQPSRDMGAEYTTLRDSWKLAQYLVDIFWQRWVREYLPTLARRTKWFRPVKPMKPGDLVVVVDEGKRNGWLRGRIVEVMPGKDGQVRKAIVETNKGLVSRPVVKLAVLDVRQTNGEPEKDEFANRNYTGRGMLANPSTISPAEE
ncbi:uncharacterized protein LOC134290436 [Aedes albopictus]|uniref:DUF5641 domain-containing protein n=1 Tax=Aedes albopictus TaxID=7160 RepID=A0ABM1YAK5_AEDAL